MTTHQFPQKRSSGGMVGVVCGELMRYAHFFMTFMVLDLPEGTQPFVQPGMDIVKQCNDMVEAARKSGSDWLWIMGDDHVFDGDIVRRLLVHDVDVVVPYCLQRSAPFNPVVYKGEDKDGHHAVYVDLPRSGLAEVYAAGSAGMLIRKHVLDALPARPFTTSRGHHNEDLEFCRHVREAGFKIHCDVDTHLGHVGTMWCAPQWLEGHGWGIALTIGPGHVMPIRRIGQEDSASLTAA